MEEHKARKKAMEMRFLRTENHTWQNNGRTIKVFTHSCSGTEEWITNKYMKQQCQKETKEEG